jgi:hypothetical protein
MVLSTGHPSDLKSFQLLGLKTSVSHAATVRVHTKKYLWAERCGESLREFGRRSGLSVTFEDIGVRKEKRNSWRRGRRALISLSVETPHYFGNPIGAPSCYVFVTLPVTLLSLPSLAVAHDNIPSSTLLPPITTAKHSRARNTATTWFCLSALFTRRNATSQKRDSHQCPVT